MIQSLLNPAKIKGSDMSYKHLTLRERYHIQAYKSRGYKNKEIAKQLDVHPSTIGREIERNKGKIFGMYFAYGADEEAKKRQSYQSSNANLKLTKEIIKLIHKYLQVQYSPEQIAATLRLKYQKETAQNVHTFFTSSCSPHNSTT
jgi:IS30 family transposase